MVAFFMGFFRGVMKNSTHYGIFSENIRWEAKVKRCVAAKGKPVLHHHLFPVAAEMERPAWPRGLCKPLGLRAHPRIVSQSAWLAVLAPQGASAANPARRANTAR